MDEVQNMNQDQHQPNYPQRPPYNPRQQYPSQYGAQQQRQTAPPKKRKVNPIVMTICAIIILGFACFAIYKVVEQSQKLSPDVAKIRIDTDIFCVTSDVNLMVAKYLDYLKNWDKNNGGAETIPADETADYYKHMAEYSASTYYQNDFKDVFDNVCKIENELKGLYKSCPKEFHPCVDILKEICLKGKRIHREITGTMPFTLETLKNIDSLASDIEEMQEEYNKKIINIDY